MQNPSAFAGFMLFHLNYDMEQIMSYFLLNKEEESETESDVIIRTVLQKNTKVNVWQKFKFFLMCLLFPFKHIFVPDVGSVSPCFSTCFEGVLGGCKTETELT